MAWPRFPGMSGMPSFGGGYLGGMGGGYPAAFSGFGNQWGGGGGMGQQGPSLEPIEPGLNPTLPCTGATGQPMQLTIDTGASLALIGMDAFRRHFMGHVQLDHSKTIALIGIGGKSHTTQGRFTMTLNLRTDTGETVTVAGDCFIIPNIGFIEVLLGMPYLIQNSMSLFWDPDYVEVEGKKVPILMKSEQYQR